MTTFRTHLPTFLLLLVLGLAVSPAAALDFSEFVTKGYEGKGELEFIAPEDLILGPEGEIVVADQKNNRLQVLRPDGTFARFITSRVDGVAQALLPQEVARHRRRGTPATTPAKPEIKKKDLVPPPTKGLVWFSETATDTTALLARPVGLALDAQGRLWVSCAGSHRVYILRFSDGRPLGEIGGQGRQPGQFDTPQDIDVRADGYFAVADGNNKRVQVFNPAGECVRQIHYKEETKKGGLRDIPPRSVLWARDGSLVVTYPTYHQVTSWDLNGNLLWRYGVLGNGKGELNQPSNLAMGKDGHLLVADSGNHRVVELDGKGMLIRNFPFSRGTAPGRLLWPRGLALTSKESLIISDQGNNRVHFFNPGKALLMLREAQALARTDQWDQAYARIEHVLNLLPNNEDARDLMVGALHFFGDRSLQKCDFTKAEESYRRILIYRPNDELVPQKLDAIFWAENRDLIIKLVFGIMAIIAALILSWIVRMTFNKVVFGHP